MTYVRGFAIALLLTSGLVFASPAGAEPFHDAKAHFSLTIPKGWQRMSAAEIEQVNAIIKSDDDSKVTAGFVANDVSDHPGAQIFIESNPIPSGGASDDQVVKEIQESFPQMTSIDDENAPLWQELKPGEARYDRKRHRLHSRALPEQVDDSSLQKIVVMQLGKTHLVRVHLFVMNEEYSSALKDFKRAVETFRMDSGFDFVASSGVQINWTRLARPIGVAAFFIISSLFGYFKMKKPKNRLPDKLDWSDSNV